MREENAFQGTMQKIEELIGTMDRSADPAMRAAAKELVSALMEVHGACFARMLDVLNRCGAAGEQAISAYTKDPLICNLMILYELHPDSLSARVTKALDKFRSANASFTVKVEVLGTDGGIVRVRYATESQGCGTGALKSGIENAILQAAPDANGIFVEDASPVTNTQSFVPLSALGAAVRSQVAVELERSANPA